MSRIKELKKWLGRLPTETGYKFETSVNPIIEALEEVNVGMSFLLLS